MIAMINQMRIERYKSKIESSLKIAEEFVDSGERDKALAFLGTARVHYRGLWKKYSGNGQYSDSIRQYGSQIAKRASEIRSLIPEERRMAA